MLTLLIASALTLGFGAELAQHTAPNRAHDHAQKGTAYGAQDSAPNNVPLPSQQSPDATGDPADAPLGLTRLIQTVLGGGAGSETGFAIGQWSAIGTGGRLPRGFPDRETQERVTADYLQGMKPVVSAAAARLRAGLGPAWRIRTNNDEIRISGPDSMGGSRSALLERAVFALSSQHTESERAKSLPPGADRTQAESNAAAAGASADEAMRAIRIDTQILPIHTAVGEDVAKALKAALPWATFAQVGGTQVVASGTAEELAVASKLAASLDEQAARQMHRARQDQIDRTQDTLASRILSQQFNIDFQGGPLVEYLRLLATTSGVESWVIEDPRLGGAYIPVIKLTGVTVDSALKVLDGITVPTADKAQPINVALNVRRIDADARAGQVPPIYRIGADFPKLRTTNNTAGPLPTITEVFDVALPLENGEAAGEERIAKLHGSLLAAIETGAGMVGPSSGFKVKLHPPSGILFVSGTPEEMELVRNIVQHWHSQL